MGPVLKVDLKFDRCAPSAAFRRSSAWAFLSSDHDWPLPFAIYSLRFSVNEADRLFWFDFSRDGHEVAPSRGTQTSDVILIKDFR
jgi:hypothetical protein